MNHFPRTEKKIKQNILVISQNFNTFEGSF